MKNDKTYLYIITIVAIVAIFSLLNMPRTTVVKDISVDNVYDADNNNLAGGAYTNINEKVNNENTCDPSNAGVGCVCGAGVGDEYIYRGCACGSTCTFYDEHGASVTVSCTSESLPIRARTNNVGGRASYNPSEQQSNNIEIKEIIVVEPEQYCACAYQTYQGRQAVKSCICGSDPCSVTACTAGDIIVTNDDD